MLNAKAVVTSLSTMPDVKAVVTREELDQILEKAKKANQLVCMPWTTFAEIIFHACLFLSEFSSHSCVLLALSMHHF
jgi:hypothetical protein